MNCKSKILGNLQISAVTLRKEAKSLKSRFVAVMICVLLFVMPLMLASPARAAATTSVKITKLANDGTTVLDQATVSVEQMMAGSPELPIYGDGVTHYYFQGPSFDPNNMWDSGIPPEPSPGETVNVDSRDCGAAKGNDVKDLIEMLSGPGASPGDVIKIKAIDGFSKSFDYEDVYAPEPRQGKLIITWYTKDAADGLSGERFVTDGSYNTGMRLLFFAETLSPEGKHVFGNWDMHETLAPSRWHYYYDGSTLWPSSSGLSVKWVSDIIIYSTESPLPELPPMTLTIVGWDGRTVILHETEVGDLLSYRAFGAYRNQLGNIRGKGYYTGVPFTALCDLVGGIQPGDTVRVTASDNLKKTFTYSEVFGGFVTWDPVTGQQVPHNQPLVPIFAYYYNDTLIPDGPLRTAIVGPEGLATASSYWVKYAVKMEIIPGPVQYASIDIDPDTLNLMSNGEWITAYIQPNGSYDAANIDASSLLLNSDVSPVLDPKYGFVTDPNEYLVDSNGDGVMERMVKFNRTEVELFIGRALTYGTLHMVDYSITMTISGQFNDGTRFKGTDIILVLFDRTHGSGSGGHK
jgi:hypothetical protein